MPFDLGTNHVAVSYCWGTTEKSTCSITTAENLERLEDHIAVSSMPQTMQDVINIARRFKVDYVWIDALCIVQDSAADWHTESTKMWDIHRNALFTIAAGAGCGVSSGCFVDKSPYPNKTNMGSILSSNSSIAEIATSLAGPLEHVHKPAESRLVLHSRA